MQSPEDDVSTASPPSPEPDLPPARDASRGASSRGDVRVFLRRFVKSPTTVGAIAPSSRFLARKMVEPVEWRSGVRVVEFGPGTGPFTAALLEQLPADGHYLGIEREPVFVDMLRERFPQAAFHCDSVENLVDILSSRGWPSVDHVVSGLPFASLPGAVIHNVLDAASAALADGGTFTTFQYLHAVLLPSARLFRRQMAERFGGMDARRVELRNLPPAFVFTWRKRGR